MITENTRKKKVHVIERKVQGASKPMELQFRGTNEIAVLWQWLISPQMVFSILYFTLFLSTFSSSASSATTTSSSQNSSTIIRLICGSSTQPANGQSFDMNFLGAMDIVEEGVDQTGFGTSVYGNNTSSAAYGLAQCYNYLSDTDCNLCYTNGRGSLPTCLTTAGGRIYLNGCFLRFGDYNFTEEVIDEYDSNDCESLTNVSNETLFTQLTNKLIQNLTSQAYERTDYYMAGSVYVSEDVSAYGIAQCWMSVNKSGCQECLESAGKNVTLCLPYSDGSALNAGCFVRYSTDPFYLNASSNSGSSSEVTTRLKITLGIISGALVVLVAALIIQWKKSRSLSRFDDIDGSTEILRSISESHLCFKYDDLRTATENFDMKNKIGHGGFGTVYKGILPDGREIAVKRLFFSTRQCVNQFFNEVNLISVVQHKNLVKLLGCSVEGPESLLVYEYICNSSLDRFLYDPFKKQTLDWATRLHIIVGTAEGLAYLHEGSEVRIIHRDIKASNILLDERFRPKIADFGLVRYFAEDQSHLSTGIAGTLGYMAPEYVVHGQLTEKADVYSYGVLILEMLTARRNTTSMSTPVDNYLMSQVWKHFRSETLMEMLDPALQGQCSEEEVVKVFRIALLCTQASPSLRPPMWKVVEMLSDMTRDLPLPSQPPYIDVQGVEAMNHSSETLLELSRYPVSANQISQSFMEGR